MKKLIMFISCVCLLFAFTACGSGGSEGSGGGIENPLTGIKASDLNIEDFEWSVDEAKFEGEDFYAFTLTNNSKYDLLGVQIEYTPKSDVTEEQLSTFDSFLKDHADYIEDDQTTSDVMLRGDRKALVRSGETIDIVPVVIGINDYTWTDIPSEEQLDLMEPEEITIGVIDGNKLYMAYYDIQDDKWKIDEATADLNKWPDVEIAKIVPKPECPAFTSNEYDSINSMDATVYGASEDDFAGYVEKVKEVGFADPTMDGDDYFAAEDKDGNRVSVTYDEYSKSYDISASGSSNDDDK